MIVVMWLQEGLLDQNSDSEPLSRFYSITLNTQREGREAQADTGTRREEGRRKEGERRGKECCAIVQPIP